MADIGKVYIMGVGPGDYKLITLKAMECLAKSDVIVYDRLISSKILSFARNDAELIYVGKMPDLHPIPQEGINDILVKKALEGKTVARVKGGDPFMFGRGGEEALALASNNIQFEIIPGVTSAISVPAYAGIPVTHRDFCSSLHIITGHEKPGKDSSFVNFDVLAKLEGTLVFLMGVKNLPDNCSNLIKYGKNPSTPVAVIENGTTKNQRTVIGTLETIEDVVKSAGIKSPAVTIIGEVVTLQEKLQWFPNGVLAGKKIIITRSREQSSKLVSIIEDLGAEAIEFPTIRIDAPLDFVQYDETLCNIKEYNWIVFTSVNGVASFFNRLKIQEMDVRNLAHIKICAVGAATSSELNNYGILVDYMPQEYTTSKLLIGLLELINPSDKVLLVRSDIANPELSDGLIEKQIDFTDLIAYRTVLEASNKENILTLLDDNKVDFITFTSSSTVKNFLSILGEENKDKLRNTKIVSIGPVTTQTANTLELDVDATADIFTIDGLVQKIIDLSK